MRIYDIIAKKRDGFELTDEEIAFFVKGSVDGTIKDYQITALLMAIYLKGMTDRETVALTIKMAESGDMLDLSGIDGVTADKHSTGGVGDKTTLIVTPIVASLGIKVAKMSGRGLGHTGGTIDKLEAIEGFDTALSPARFIENVKKHGICVVGQTGNLAPADKIFYALRDATATVGCMPLIASSIMSKKLAAGSECIVLDVKYGSGAFMKTAEDAEALSKMMVDIGTKAGRKVAAVISDMDTPLGFGIGNSLEIKEAVEVLKGENVSDLKEVCLTLAANIIKLAEGTTIEDARTKVETALSSGAAYEKFKEFIASQGGSIEQIENTELLPSAEFKSEVLSPYDGYICRMNAEKIGSASVILGAGREKKEDKIDFGAGIVLHKKTGDFCKKGESLATLYTNKADTLKSAEKCFLEAISFGEDEPNRNELIYKVV
ncbi:MAG: pyrimidine-nucleoside phosphorylase [Clostridia bacterium]|nr:pyrimidine-nucleoside phosphorylase [Clostridia bacterium]